MGRFRVLPYKQGSQGARALADALDGRVLFTNGSKYRPKPDDVVIRWGAAREGERLRGFKLVNDLSSILQATDKLKFFRLMQTSNADIIPEFWTDAEDIPDEAFPIVARTVLNGHSGEGIVIAETRDELPHAPLYVKYVKKQHEYRVHLGWDSQQWTTIAVQRKARKHDHPEDAVDWKVRNLKNGFIYARHNVQAPEVVLDAARRAMEASGLEFGAADVIMNERNNQAYVLEINTAPGLTGQTVEDYAEFFRGRMQG